MLAQASWIVIVIALSLAGIAKAQPSLGTAVRIEDRSGRSLEPLHRALARAERREGRARLVFWGASHTASDQCTGVLREELQRRFGDAGPGLVLPARAFSLYDHRLVRVAPLGAWRAVRVRGRDRARGVYGPHGIALDASGPAEAWVELASGVAPVDEVHVHFLRQASGGTIEVRTFPSGARERVRTTGARTDELVIRAPGAIRRVEIRAAGDGPVRLFGVSLERAGPGVIVDALGIPGARMRDRLPWDDAALRAQLVRLSPDLIALAYGTNESGGNGAIEREVRAVDEALRRARALAPQAACLVIGPSDWPRRGPDGTWSMRARTAQIVEVMRDAARRHGCAFLDLVAFMGGPGSMPRWVSAGLALDDHVHFTDEGYRRLARALYRALSRE